MRLGQLGAATYQYTVDNDDWLPGSPGTTGAPLIYDYGDSGPEIPMLLPLDVTQIWDWAGPLAGYLGVELKAHRVKRNRRERRREYWCPANHITAEPFPWATSNGWAPMRMISYNAMRIMYYFEDSVPLAPELEPWARKYSDLSTGISLPIGYRPQLGFLGPPSEKVFVADGARFTTPFGDTDYDYHPLAHAGGMFAGEEPTTPDQYMHSYYRSAVAPELAARAYRHPHGDALGLNAVHFDGHVEWVSEADSRLPDRWFPSGTVIPFWEMNTETQLLTHDDWGPDHAYHVP